MPKCSVRVRVYKKMAVSFNTIWFTAVFLQFLVLCTCDECPSVNFDFSNSSYFRSTKDTTTTKQLSVTCFLIEGDHPQFSTLLVDVNVDPNNNGLFGGNSIRFDFEPRTLVSHANYSLVIEGQSKGPFPDTYHLVLSNAVGTPHCNSTDVHYPASLPIIHIYESIGVNLSFVKPTVVSLPGRVCVAINKQGDSGNSNASVNVILSSRDSSVASTSKMLVLAEMNKNEREVCFSNVTEGNYTATLNSLRVDIENGTASVEVTTDIHRLVSDPLASVLEQFKTNLSVLEQFKTNLSVLEQFKTNLSTLQNKYDRLQNSYDDLQKKYQTLSKYTHTDTGKTCKDSPCKNGGSCIAPDDTTHPDGIQCSCEPGFTGKICEKEIPSETSTQPSETAKLHPTETVKLHPTETVKLLPTETVKLLPSETPKPHTNKTAAVTNSTKETPKGEESTTSPPASFLVGWVALLLFCAVLAILVLAYIGYYWREKIVSVVKRQFGGDGGTPTSGRGGRRGKNYKRLPTNLHDALHQE